MSRIHVVSGLQAAGKSTVADLLARRSPRGVHVAGDAVRAMVVSGRVDMAPGNPDGALEQLFARYEASIAVAATYDRAGFAIVIEDVIVGAPTIRFLELLPWPQIHFVMLTPRREVILRREQERSKTAYGKIWSVDGLAQVLERDTPVFGRWLDTSDLTPEQTADRILAEPAASLVQVRDVLDRHRLASVPDATA